MYCIVRFWFDRPDGVRRRIIESGLTLEEAQAWCQRKDTSSSTCTNTRRAHGASRWFDGYERQ